MDTWPTCKFCGGNLEPLPIGTECPPNVKGDLMRHCDSPTCNWCVTCWSSRRVRNGAIPAQSRGPAEEQVDDPE